LVLKGTGEAELTTQVYEEAAGNETGTAIKDRPTPKPPPAKKDPGIDPGGRGSSPSLSLDVRAVVRILAYLSQPTEHACGGFVPVSRIVEAINQPINTVNLILLRLGRAGYVRTRGALPDEAAFIDTVREKSLAELVQVAHSQGQPEGWIKARLGESGNLLLKDILPAPAVKARVPIHLKVAAASVLVTVFCMAAFGLYKIPAAFLGLGLTLLLVSYTLRWFGKRRNLDTLPQCILEAVMSGSMLWVIFGLADLFW
jgi:hypothetical protein